MFNIPEILVGVLLILWGFLYTTFIINSFKIKNDDRPSCEGLVKSFKEENEKLYLEIEYTFSNQNYTSLASIYDQKDKEAVGNNVYLRVNPNDYQEIEIDWDKEQESQRNSVIKKMKLLKMIFGIVGIILIIHGLRLF